jgi:hypothetical protein
MLERKGEIVDFHLGAFNTEVAIAYGYTTNDTPRTPAALLYAEHRAYANWASIEAHQIFPGDKRLRALGLTSIEHAMTRQRLQDAEPDKVTAQEFRERMSV